MTNKILILVIAIFIIAIFLFLINSGNAEKAVPMDIYKSASCGCCVGFSGIAGKSGFDVNLITTEDMQGIKSQYGIPTHMESCHTSIVEGYFVEGHVPISVINKLLEEEPENILGIALPRMPAGSTGMPGVKQEDFVIHALHTDGEWREYMRV